MHLTGCERGNVGNLIDDRKVLEQPLPVTLASSPTTILPRLPDRSPESIPVSIFSQSNDAQSRTSWYLPEAQRTRLRAGPPPPSWDERDKTKSLQFQISIDDPCYKVLPAALRHYDITAPWEQDRTIIRHGRKAASYLHEAQGGREESIVHSEKTISPRRKAKDE